MGAPRSTTIRVREESMLKADKWQLAIRLRDMRVVVDKTRAENEQNKQDNDRKQAQLDKRRDNLKRARSLLDTLSAHTASSLATESETSGETIATIKGRQAWIQRQHHVMFTRVIETRLILTRELLTAFGFAVVQPSRPLPSPFKSPTSSTSSLTSSYTSSPGESLAHVSPAATGPIYTLGHQVLPPLSALGTLSGPQLSAVLQHLMHITRLFALYQDVCLPFTPVHSLFGPGLPGIKATPGWGDSVPSASSAQHVRAWPLFVSKSLNASSSTLRTADSQLAETILSDSELDATIVPYSAIESDYAAQAAMLDRTNRGREIKKKALRIKMALIGAVAVAFDLAFLAWKRGVDELSVDCLDDIGSLIMKAAGLPDAKAARQGPKTILSVPRLGSDSFPISFHESVTKYTVPSKRARRMTGEDSADEEWDFV
ncbi:hypothetical protein OIV83_002067 [Microbotryomycetes sp. JL201]|nr:hypothetical protein OIV83_002067 [Microbotryomycetes sp. JL201]